MGRGSEGKGRRGMARLGYSSPGCRVTPVLVWILIGH